MWQEGYFDHRLRSDERGTQVSAKLNYIRENPVAAGLCVRAEGWPWVIDPFGSEGGSARRGGTMAVDSPGRYQAATPQCLSQHVEDNAFHLSLVAINPGVYLLPGLTAGILARSDGSLSAGNVSTFISIKLTNGQPKSGLVAPLRSTITPTAETTPP